MATICYAWDDAPYAWLDTPFTWAEGCIIEKLLGNAGGSISSYKIRERLDALPDKDKEVLIGLFVRLNVDEFEKKSNKNKNTKVKIKLKDIEVSLKEQRNINVNIFIK